MIKLFLIFIFQFHIISPCNYYVPCNAGYYLDALACVCKPCPKGQYNEAKDGACKSCSPGTYSDESGAGFCKDCPVNTYNPDYGSKSSSSCIPCEEGLISILGSSKCVEESMKCTLYSYNYACTSCDSEEFEKCDECEEGYYLKDGGCKYCGFYCKKCTSRDICLECEEDYVFDSVSKECVDKHESENKGYINSIKFYILLLLLFAL